MSGDYLLLKNPFKRRQSRRTALALVVVLWQAVTTTQAFSRIEPHGRSQTLQKHFTSTHGRGLYHISYLKASTKDDDEASKDRATLPHRKHKHTRMKRNKNQRIRAKKKKKFYNNEKNGAEHSSLLPPPSSHPSQRTTGSPGEDSLSSGLSSWEEFLQRSMANNSETTSKSSLSNSSKSDDPVGSKLHLPAIEELFPPNISSVSPVKPASSTNGKQQSVLDGVLPVSDLFYRSSDKPADEDGPDDEELPFSAEQSDAVSMEENNSSNNKQPSAPLAPKPKQAGRKMVRRGMEMLVGGVPIHADPPQRSVELSYDNNTDDVFQAITLSTRDFGPLLHTPAQVKPVERGLFCEHFTHAALKWDVCPADLRRIAKDYRLEQARQASSDDTSDLWVPSKGFGKPASRGKKRKSQNNNQSNLFLGANSGVFPDYSTRNSKNAPFGGNIGLRLVDAAVERAKQRHPRVIAVGDVHGCIDELQDLLRECDYRPGDLVVFLGDLVCKGPDSISVVQMAREIGAVGVRGNHDFEVIRWHQAIKSGVDPPVVASEHFHIASCLSRADMKWLYSLPWYLSSKELGSLFVHAGFVSGIRLSKQNPRLMMNMRSILPDGTVTSKYYGNWPWSRLWNGPQTVFFGHDADRGLQQYEHAIGLDTGCVYGGRLTACILPEKRLVSVSARREYFKYRRKHYD